jgi:hypothetical protein
MLMVVWFSLGIINMAFCLFIFRPDRKTWKQGVGSVQMTFAHRANNMMLFIEPDCTNRSMI